jgi:signal transduction histidine kinase
MFRFPALSVNTRIVIPFLIAIIVVAGIGVFTVTRLVAGSVQERLHNQLLDSASAASNTVVEIEREILSVLRLMVFTDGVGVAVESRDLNSLDSWLRPIAANAQIDDFMIFDRDGEGLLHLRRLTETQYEVQPTRNMAEWVGVQRVLRGETDALGDKYVDIDARDGESVFFISAPLRDETDQLVGGISVGIRGTTLARRMNEQALSAVALLNQEQVIATTFRGESPALYSGYQEIAFETESQTPIRDVEFDSTNYAVLYAPFRMRGQELGLIAVGLPSNFIADRSSTSRNIVGTLFLALFAAITVIGLVVARTITNPISRLVNVTRSIRGGNLSIRVGLESRDELGDLSRSFDQMTDKLVSSNRQVRTLYRHQLQETARRDAVLASINDPVIVQDLNGESVLHNRTAEILLRDTAQHPQEYGQLQQLMNDPKLLTNAQVVNFIQRFFSVLATPVILKNGTLIGYVIVFHDITELIESEQLKDELMLQLSHELRTPLSAIRGYAELVKLLESANMSERSVNFMDNAITNIETLERMINQSIMVSQILSNRLPIEEEQFDLVPLLEEICHQWMQRMESRSLLLTAVLPPHPITVYGDQGQIREVFNHLLVNAYSYTLDGGQIQLEAKVVNGCVQVNVTDTGVGIDEDELQFVFDRLFRGKSADAGPTDARGLGLGLYIVRYIVEAHHGTITIKSKRDEGTGVYVELPLYHRHEERLLSIEA